VRLLLPIVALVVLAGCLDPGAPPTGTPPRDEFFCPEIPEVMLRVDARGFSAPPEKVMLIASPVLSVQLSCIGPAVEETLPFGVDSLAAGAVDKQAYEEVRLLFNDSVWRAIVPVPALENGTLNLTRGSGVSLNVSWNDRALPVAVVERFDNPHALDPHFTGVDSPVVNRTWVFNFTANSSVNRGLFAQVLMSPNHTRYDSDEARAPLLEAGSEVRVRAIAPNGSVAFEHVWRHWMDSGEDTWEPIAKGPWRVEVQSRMGRLGPGDMSFQFSLQFRH